MICRGGGGTARGGDTQEPDRPRRLACRPLFNRQLRVPLQAVKYSEIEDTAEDSCAVCLVDYEAEDELRNLPCKHAFHKLVSAFPTHTIKPRR